VILKRGQNIKYLPYAFTEHGAIMAANVISSARAVRMSVFVVRAFVRLRQLAIDHKELATRLSELERRVANQDGHIKALFQAVRELTGTSVPLDTCLLMGDPKYLRHHEPAFFFY
jgi:hypothetical protein